MLRKLYIAWTNQALAVKGLTISDEKRFIDYKVGYTLGYILVLIGLFAYGKASETIEDRARKTIKQNEIDWREELRGMAEPTKEALREILGDQPYIIRMPDGAIYDSKGWRGDANYAPVMIRTFSSYAAALEVASMIGGKVEVVTKRMREELGIK